MLKANADIRQAIHDSGIKYWKIADELKITDGNFSRLLRHELSKEKKEKTLKIIEKLKEKEK